MKDTFTEKFEESYRSIIAESISKEDIPSLELVQEYQKNCEVPADSPYMKLQVGDYLEAVGGNSGWGQTKGQLEKIEEVVYPGFYKVVNVNLKNAGDKENQKWELNTENTENIRKYETYAICGNPYNKKDVRLYWYTGKRTIKDKDNQPKETLDIYINGWKLVPDLQEYLDELKVDYSFDPYK